jgi:hypothetical protein
MRRIQGAITVWKSAIDKNRQKRSDFHVYSVAAIDRKKMGRRKQDIIWLHLNDGGGNLEKNWYVEYTIRDPVSGKMERFRHYDRLKNFDNVKERLEYAKKMIKQYTNDIKAGKIGFVSEVEYEDFLRFGGAVKKKKTFAGSANMYISDFIKYKATEITQKSFLLILNVK